MLGYYKWAPGTYYWEAWRSGLLCKEGETTRFCTLRSPVWTFTVTPIPPPEPVSPADGAVVPVGTTVEFVVHSAARGLPSSPGGDYRTRLQLRSSAGGFESLEWSHASPDGSLYFDWKAYVAPVTITWTPVRLDLKAGGEVPGPSRRLTIVRTESPTSPSANQTPVSAHAYCSSARERLGRINHRVVCLHAGEYCSWRYRQQYRRYHFACVRKGHRFRLV
jgi:hypothetical protein